MHISPRTVVFPAAISLVAMASLAALGQKLPTAASSPRPADNSVPAITVDQVNQSLSLAASEIIELSVDPTPEQAQTLAVEIDGAAYTMALTPAPIRAAGYRLVAQIEDGSYVDVDPGPDRMLRGTLVEVPGSHIAGGLMQDGLHVTIVMPDGQGGVAQRWIEPLAGRIPGARADQYALYRSEDVIKPESTCGVNDAFLAAHPPAIVNPGAIDGETDGGAVHCTELAADADFEFFTLFGSSVINVQDRINLVINTMNLQYINQVGIQHVITQIIVRTSVSDPYTSFDAGTLLGEFQNHWNANHANVPRDVAHLFTGRNINGSTIGIAYLGVICNTGSAYGVVESNCCGSLACSTDLSAHELGHNWNAQHCSGSCSSTMNSGLTCVNTFLNSNPSSVTQIVNFRNSRTCLSACADAALPFVDNFPSTTFDAAKWTTISGAVIDTVGISEPSPANSMRLRGNSSTGGHQARTSRIDASGMSILNLQYYYQRRGGGDQPEPGDDLIVEYFNTAGNWIEISRQLGNGPAMTTYALASHEFPADALHTEFRLRFRVSSSQTNLDDWFVDDVNIAGIAPPANNNCDFAAVKGAGSHAFTTIGATTDGPSEPGACSVGGFNQIDRDVWYKFLAQCTGTATISLCGANYDAKLAVYPNICPGVGGLTIACNDNFCGNAPQVSFPVNSGTIYKVRIGGVNNASGSGTMVITCVPTPTCQADTNSDGQVNVNDLLAVINAWGACAGCPADTNGDGQVNVNDLLAVINAWGACP